MRHKKIGDGAVHPFTPTAPNLGVAGVSRERMLVGSAPGQAKQALNAGMDLDNVPSVPEYANLAKAFIQMRAECGLDRYEDIAEILELVDPKWDENVKSNIAVQWNLFVKASTCPYFLRYISEHLDVFFDVLERSKKIPEAVASEQIEKHKVALKEAFEKIEKREERRENFAESLKPIIVDWRKGVKQSGFADFNNLLNIWDHYRMAEPENFKKTISFSAWDFMAYTRSKDQKTLPKLFKWLREEGNAEMLIEAVNQAGSPYVNLDDFTKLVHHTKTQIDALAEAYPEFTAAAEKSGGGRGRGGRAKSVKLAPPPPWETKD